NDTRARRAAAGLRRPPGPAARRAQTVDRRGLCRLRPRRRIRRARCSRACRCRVDSSASRPGGAAAERPRRVAGRRRAPCPRRVPGGRQRSRPDPLRALRPPRRREARTARAGAPRANLDHGSSVVRLKAMYGTQAIEHGTSPHGRWLRERRLRITLWIAAVEGLLYLFGALHWWAAVVLAIIAVA